MREISEVKINELLNMINEALTNGISVNKFSKDMGWNSSSVKTKLKRGGYGYDANLKKYIPKDKVNTNKNTKIDTKIKNNKDLKDTKININENTKNNMIKNTKDIDIEVVLKKLGDFEKRLLNLESNRNDIRRSKRNKHIINNTRETSTKSIRLYTEVKKQLDEYLAQHNDKKVIEVFSYAILDYINKYK